MRKGRPRSVELAPGGKAAGSLKAQSVCLASEPLVVEERPGVDVDIEALDGVGEVQQLP